MKKTLLIVGVAALLCSCANKQKFVIEGDMPELEGTAYLFEKDSLIDSAVVVEGKFRFEGIVEAPGMRNIRDKAEQFSVPVILEAGTISIAKAGDDARPRATGTPANDAFNTYMEAANVLFQEFRNPETTQERQQAIMKEYNDMAKKTVEQNTSNYFGVELMSNVASGFSAQEVLDLIAKFSPEMQATTGLTDQKTRAEQSLKTDIGQPYIDIVQNNAEGQPVSLKSVIGNPANKYTLVDFWASWCGPCMGEVPELLRTYKEFHDKGFEIYGVSFDTDKEKWLAAVKDNGMDWIHVSDLNQFDNQAGKDYSVRGIPSNFLIDAQGVIVAKNLRGEALYNKVSELLAQ